MIVPLCQPLPYWLSHTHTDSPLLLLHTLHFDPTVLSEFHVMGTFNILANLLLTCLQTMYECTDGGLHRKV